MVSAKRQCAPANAPSPLRSAVPAHSNGSLHSLPLGMAAPIRFHLFPSVNILRKHFGPSRRSLATALGELKATYVEGEFWNGDKVQATHGEWTIILDTYTVSGGRSSVTFTRIRAPYVNPDRFRFTIYRRGLFSDIGKWFGMQDVVVGHPDFDREFIIKGTQEGKLRALFDNPKIRELISAQPQIHLTVKDHEGYFGRNSRRTPTSCTSPWRA